MHGRIVSWTSKHGPLLAMAGGQAIAIIFAILLSRVFLPSDFGNYQLYLSIFIISSILIPLRYEVALYEVRGEKLKSARSAILICIITASVVAAFTGLSYTYLKESNDGLLLAMIAVSGALCAGILRILQAIFALDGNKDLLSGLNLLRPPAVPGIQLILGLFSATTVALVFGQALANLCLVLLFLFFSGLTSKIFQRPEIRELWGFMTRYKGYPLFSLPQNLVFVAGEALVPLLLISKFGVAFGGLYWYASKLAASPMQVLVESIRPIIYTRIGQEVGVSGNNAARYALSYAAKLSGFILTLAVVVQLIGEPIFVYVLGEKWGGIGPLAAALIFGLVAHAIATPYIASLNIIGLSKHYLFLEVTLLLTKATLIALLSDHGTLLVVWYLSIAAVAAYLLFFMFAHRRLKSYSGAVQ